MKNENSQALEMFAKESADRLTSISLDLERLSQSRQIETETVHSIFRHTHSLKSAANLIGMEPVELLLHKLEDVLEMIRTSKDSPDERLVEILKIGYARINWLMDNPHFLKLVDIDSEIAGIEKLLSR